MKQFIKKIPVLGKLAMSVKKLVFPGSTFISSEAYWIERYKSGGNSGAGSYNNLAEFKGEVINSFVSEHKIGTVMDLGCGDGNQLEYFEFPSYLGFDISPDVIRSCRFRFKQDESKQFLLMDELSDQRADMVMSLDVIYHLVEDDVYHAYMDQLFASAISYVVIYSCNEDSDNYAPHIRARRFTNWIREHKPEFELVRHIPNSYPLEKGKGASTTFSDFYFYGRNN